MVFHPPPWVPKLPFSPPDSISIYNFIFDENFGRHPLGYSFPPFTCGLSGKEYSALDVKDRVEALARGLAKELGWSPNQGTEWDKVIGVFSVNTIDTLTLAWATHRLGGLQTPANAAYSAPEIEFQLKDSGAKCLFTCVTLLDTALEAAQKAGIPKNRIYFLDLPKEATGGKSVPSEFKTVDQLIQEGSNLPRLDPLRWKAGDGAKKTAFLCYSSGTSGLPKGVMISHKNVIANTMQITAFDKPSRDRKIPPGTQSDYTDTLLGLLPMSHIYGLVVVCLVSAYRGDRVVVLPKFEMKPYLNSIQQFKINTLYLVPPIIIMMAKSKSLLDQYDLSSVDAIFTGAAPLGQETAEDLAKQYPKIIMRQGYGLTETSTVVCSTSTDDVWFGSSGSLVPGVEAKLVSLEGNEITGYDQPGELVVKSPSVTLGYLNRPDATKETFQDGWMRTGDEAVVKKSPQGYEHIFIVDRIKELIKVKGLQVAPAELEAHLLTHPAVNDCAVIPVPDERAGEVPKAFVVKSSSVGLEESDRMVARDIKKHVEKHKSRHKWLAGGVEFVDVIPKSPSGKILPIMSAQHPHHAEQEHHEDEEHDMLDPEEAGEEVPEDEDMHMDSDDEGEEDAQMQEIQLHNDSAAHFDGHKDSIFCIAQHPVHPSIVATGGGDDVGYIFEAKVDQKENPPLPASWSGSQSGAEPQVEREGLQPIAKLEGHTDSIVAIAFTQPAGEYVVTAGMDGRLKAWRDTSNGSARSWNPVGEQQEVEEITWLSPCPHPSYPNTVALGASDGSVWIYTINADDPATPLTIVQAFYLHTESSTAGTWTADGKLLATVAEDASFYVWDAFGDAAAAGLTNPSSGQAIVGLTAEDERFRVEGGLYSVAIAPNGAFAAVGGAGGHVRIVGMPRLSGDGASGSVTSGAKGAGARNKAGGAKQSGGPRGGASSVASGQAGTILAALQTQSDSVETLAFSAPPLTLLAAGSVDGSIALFDTAHRFAVRRHIQQAHVDEEEGTEQAQGGAGGWILTSCGNDGVLRRWDTRGGTAAVARGLAGEWRGHRGGGEGGGIMGFVQGGAGRIVTAGDDGVALVFETPIA
ncbi:acetyl-CoA synthetase-like protein [Saccharata proteae CBS 121410]|uniref:Acetyl-CoA synthetase-like protein n=1 Tax=Saccharata proteae CBS 121410 TaxID=1314787 RepID=A0A9P4HR82_9PEZI|nr:acetyl-CoA synthetase-like protein [Saccharata proteae CBS 121410]